MKLWIILCFILGLSGELRSSSDGKTYKKEVGSNFTIPCSLPLGENDGLELNKQGHDDEILIYKRKIPIIQNETYKGRIFAPSKEELEKNNSAKIKLTVTMSDDGQYSCRYTGQKEEWINFTLVVKEKPSNPTATKAPFIENSSSTGGIIGGVVVGVVLLVIVAVVGVVFLYKKCKNPQNPVDEISVRKSELKDDTPTQATGTHDERTTEQQNLEENRPLMDGSQESSPRLRRTTESHLSRSCNDLNQDPSQRDDTLKKKSATYPPSTELKKAA